MCAEPHWPSATVGLGHAHLSSECVSGAWEQVEQGCAVVRCSVTQYTGDLYTEEEDDNLHKSESAHWKIDTEDSYKHLSNIFSVLIFQETYLA